MAQTTLETSQLARLIDVTPRYVRKLTAEGVISRAVDGDGRELMGRYSLLAIRDYCRWLRAKMKLEDTSESRRAELQNIKLAAESELAQLKLKEYKGALHHARHIEFIWTSVLTRFKARLLALPSRVARLCVGKKFREILDIITREIELVLRELSRYDPTAFKKQRDEFLETEGIDLSSLNGESEKRTEDQEPVEV
jgi:phage terminase Nu1 subunit (DNA packaging protein)